MATDENEKFFDLLSSFDTAMLVTQSNENAMVGRPMAIAQVDITGSVWFISADNTEKVDEIKNDSHVLVTCQRDHGAYLSLSGLATTSKDRAKIAELWKPMFESWFPEGKGDSRVTLICVKAERGEYWDNRGMNGVRYLYQAVTAYATGTTPDIKEGEQHGTVRL